MRKSFSVYIFIGFAFPSSILGKKSAESATIDVVTSGQCGDELLKAKGVDPSTYQPAIEFDKSKFRFDPAKPKVPGCIHLIVTNSTIKQPLQELTAEFELRVGVDPDPNNPKISCRQKQKPCSCSSGKTSCVQCDFCKNIRKSLKRVNVSMDRKTQSAQNMFDGNGCGCKISPGLYDIDSEVCTPSAKEMKQDLPDDLQKYASQGAPVKESLGEGGYGAVYHIWDNMMKEDLAIKVELERPANNEPGLEVEITVIKKLQFSRHVTRFKDEGRVGPLRYVIMQLVGKNLADLRSRCPRGKFSPFTTAQLALQCINAISDVHSIGWVHRDIKPSNFAIGRTQKDERTVFILDFGLVRSYLTSNGQMKQPRHTAGFRGTVRYAAVNAHQKKELGRGDDLWSWLYMIVEMDRGLLPWRNETDRDVVGEIKTTTPRHKLLGDMAKEYASIYEYIKGLTYDTPPDYDYISKLVQQSIKNEKPCPLDWEKGGKAFQQSQAANAQPYAMQMPDKDNVINDRLPGECTDEDD